MKKITLLSIILIFLVSCATNKATINTYVDPNFSQGEVQNVAVFPIRNTRLAPSESKQINRKISQAIKRENSSIQIMSSSEAIRILNENELSDDWAQFLDDYATSGVPNSNILSEIGSTLGVDAILQGEIVNIFQEDGQYGGNRGTTRVTVRFSMLNTNEGNLIWESSSDGIKGTSTTLASAPPIIDAINLAVDKILDSLPNL
jgi:PBP1b-binding outer membrane lipoprotein LpoB